MRRAVARAVIIVAVAALASPFAVSAQATTQERATRPLFLAGVEKSRPLHEAASVGILFPVRPLQRSGDLGAQLRAYRGVIVEAAAGAEGFELAAGWGRRLKQRNGFAIFGEDVMATVFRTQNSSGGNADATFVGGEVGLTMLTFRVSVGAAARVSEAAQSERTIFTWGVGFNLGR